MTYATRVLRLCAPVAPAILLLSLGAGTVSAGPPAAATPAANIKGKTYRMERAYYVAAHVPVDDVDRVVAAVGAAVGLEYGNYDQVAYINAEGLEQFRPLTGSKAGAAAEPGRNPTKVVSFSVPHDDRVLKKALDAIYASHSYEEPVIYVTEVLRSRETSRDEKNPNKWWNQPSQPH